MTSRPTDSRWPRRRALVLAATVTTALGLTIRVISDGLVSVVAGDALYAVLIYLLVAFVAPRARPAIVAVVAWGLCAAVELAQLVGLARAVVDVWEPARWVLGTTFHAPDLLVYALGACAAAVVDAVVMRRRPDESAPTSAGTPARRSRRPRWSPAPARLP